ncbi:MAG: bifunctional metallophosphatase/5'-nucleotidase [Aerococcus sp.]|nr:bifunctional metallophosphatase/5'-nucleotidase [Aerococcus sp.]
MKLTILETSDVHGYLTADSDINEGQFEDYGLTRVTAKIQEIREQSDHPVLLIDNGDTIQGSPFAAYQHSIEQTPKAITDTYNTLGIDFWVPGNHEFNFGMDYLLTAKSQFESQTLCANILDRNGVPALGQPYEIREIDGVKVGIIGVTTAYIPHWEEPEHIEGLTFISALETCERWVPYLKEQRHCDVIIVSYHGGLECDPETGEPTETDTGENEGYAIATSGLPIDVLLTGHQHREIEAEINGIPVLQPGTRGHRLSRVDITVEPNDAGQTTVSTTHQLIDCREIPEQDAMRQTLLPRVADVQKWLDLPCGTVSEDLTVMEGLYEAQKHGNRYFDFINQIQMETMNVEISATSGFNDNVKGFSGDISMRDILQNYPYPNKIVTSQLTGRELKQVLEKNVEYFEIDDKGEIGINPSYLSPKYQAYNFDFYSGIDYTVDLTQPAGQRVQSVMFKGQELTDDQKLRIAYNQYRAGGGGDFPVFDQAHIVDKCEDEMPDLIARYVSEHSPVDLHVSGHLELLTDH